MPGLNAGVNALVAQSKRPSKDDTSELIRGAILAAQAQLSGSSSDAGALKDQLWYGGTSRMTVTESGGARPKNLPMEQTVVGGRKPVTVDAALNLPYQWMNNPTKLQKLYAAASAATGKPVADFFTALDVWQKAVSAANASWVGTNGGTKGVPLTPWTAMDLMKRSAGTSLSRTETHKTISDVSDGTAWKTIQNAAQQLLGRAPTGSEIQEFAHKANQIAANNPSITTTTVDANGNQTTKTKGGYSQDDLDMAATSMANADPEAGAFQAAGPLYNEFLKAISNPF